MLGSIYGLSTKRRSYQLCQSTLTFAACATVILFLLEIPGQRISGTFFSKYMSHWPDEPVLVVYEHGWPYPWLTRSWVTSEDEWGYYQIPWLSRAAWNWQGDHWCFDWLGALVDALVVVGLLFTVLPLWERRVRRRLRVFQFSMMEFILGLALAVVLLVLPLYDLLQRHRLDDYYFGDSGSLSRSKYPAFSMATQGATRPVWLQKLFGAKPIELLLGAKRWQYLHSVSVDGIATNGAIPWKLLDQIGWFDELHIENCRITDEDARRISRQTQLTALTFDKCPAWESHIHTLRSLHRLRGFYIYGAYSDKSMKGVAQFPDLEQLVLQEGTTRDISLVGEADARTGKAITDQGAKELLRLRYLRVLEISRATITSTTREQLRQLPLMRNLDVDDQ